MSPETLEALEASIEKWKALTKLTAMPEKMPGWKECPLCLLFNTPNKEFKPDYQQCAGCPVLEYTEESGCYGTPYEDVKQAYNNKDFPAFIQAAEEELEFLESLLP